MDDILKTFRSLYNSYFTTPCDRVFEKPKDLSKCRIPIQNLIDRFIHYINNASLREERNNKIGSRLKSIGSWMKSTSFDLAPFEPLATLILNHATDREVWCSLNHLIETLEIIIVTASFKNAWSTT
ncbi:BgTH12-05751 [Blumeria graminis f. sp. triticale]|uniref:Bgt-50900 n=2 Tax=Blumeria graminis TaxID=34373 RepID=A0A9X9QEH2_BLUGR|nr:BgTH12-05751 [Blumeria graminis f. sp. triticale]VDB90744.1 Bgt-50900 [Blumeria graminis f. sp. tritici]